ncbi:MAG: hypothetical protein ACFBSC_05860 [Microcoleaceae cyanobacterium]
MINTGELALTNGGQLRAETFGGGNAGSVIVDARNSVFIDGIDESLAGNNTRPSTTASFVAGTATGDGGGVQISGDNIFVSNRAQVDASTFGQCNAGNVTLNGRSNITLDTAGSVFTNVGIDRFTNLPGVGEGGNIDITTGNLAVMNTAQLQAQTSGVGNAGNVSVNASGNVFFDGFEMSDDETIFSSRAFTIVENSFPGIDVRQGGDVSISAENIYISNRAGLSTSTIGEGNAGRIILQAQEGIIFESGGNADSAV